MLEHLFGSKTRFKLLKIFFRDPEKQYYVRELTRLVEAQINAIRRELDLLVKSAIVRETGAVAGTASKSTPGINLRKYYTINKESILYPELLALIQKSHMLGEQKFVDEIRQKGGEIRLFLLSGKFTSDKRAPVDILLVGEISERQIEKLINQYEKDLGFDIRYTVMSEREFFDRRQVMDKFLYSVFESENLKVVNMLKV